MTKWIVTLGGLPRSGSTVLTSILNQHPAIYASPNSPLVELLVNVNRHLNTTEQARAFLQPTQIDDVLRRLIQGFYDFTERTLIVDKSRGWPHPENLALLARSTEQPVVCIVTVRDIAAIAASFLRRVHACPPDTAYIDVALQKAGRPRTDEERVEWLLSPGGTIYESYQALRAGYDSEWRSCLHIIEYDELVERPLDTLAKLYEVLGLPHFTHDLTHIENPTPERDYVYGIPGLHQVRPALRSTAPDPSTVLSPEVFARCQAVPHFWREHAVTPPSTPTRNPLHLTNNHPQR